LANPRTIARLEARIHERAAHCLEFELNDPRSSFITITKVELATDLGSCKIYYAVLGDDGDRSKVAHMLESAAGFIQRQVGRVLQLRRVPHLRWVFDDSILRSAEVDEAIKQALDRDKRIAEQGRDDA
jgi:ribosome-binding factor A